MRPDRSLRVSEVDVCHDNVRVVGFNSTESKQTFDSQRLCFSSQQIVRVEPYHTVYWRNNVYTFTQDPLDHSYYSLLYLFAGCVVWVLERVYREPYYAVSLRHCCDRMIGPDITIQYNFIDLRRRDSLLQWGCETKMPVGKTVVWRAASSRRHCKWRLKTLNESTNLKKLSRLSQIVYSILGPAKSTRCCNSLYTVRYNQCIRTWRAF